MNVGLYIIKNKTCTQAITQQKYCLLKDNVHVIYIFISLRNRYKCGTHNRRNMRYSLEPFLLVETFLFLLFIIDVSLFRFNCFHCLILVEIVLFFF